VFGEKGSDLTARQLDLAGAAEREDAGHVAGFGELTVGETPRMLGELHQRAFGKAVAKRGVSCGEQLHLLVEAFARCGLGLAGRGRSRLERGLLGGRPLEGDGRRFEGRRHRIRRRWGWLGRRVFGRVVVGCGAMSRAGLRQARAMARAGE
jgi:hypothetical protein